MIYIITILLFLLCYIDYIKNRKILTPRFIFNIMWFITLMLYEMHLSYIQQVLSEKTIFIFLIAILSYNLSYFICENFNLKDIKLNIKPKKTIESKINIAKWITIIIFFAEIIYSKGYPLLWKMTKVSKTYFDFGIPSLNGALYGLIICLGAYSLFTKSKDKYIYLGMGVLMISRQVILSIIVEGIIYLFLTSKEKINYKKIFILLIIIFVGFTAIGNFRSGNNIMNDTFKARHKYRNIPTTIKWGYSYATFSVSNFNNLVSMTNGNVNHGVSMLQEFMPTVILNKVNIKAHKNYYYLVSDTYNVSTYLPSIYIDFGIFGVALFNMLMALIGYLLYKKLLNEKSDKNALMYAVFIHNIIFMFFINMFLYLPIVIQLLYIPIIFSGKKEKNE